LPPFNSICRRRPRTTCNSAPRWLGAHLPRSTFCIRDLYDVTDPFGYDSLDPTEWDFEGVAGDTIGWTLVTKGNPLSQKLSPRTRYTNFYGGGLYTIPTAGFAHVEASVFPAVPFKIPLYWSPTSTVGSSFKNLNPLTYNANGTSTTEGADTYKLDAASLAGFAGGYFSVNIPAVGYSACLIVFEYQ
jgi:hypothetical protein